MKHIEWEELLGEINIKEIISGLFEEDEFDEELEAIRSELSKNFKGNGAWDD